MPRKIMAFIVLILFAVLFQATALGLTAQRSLLDADFYKKEFRRQDFYEGFHSVFLSQFAEEMEGIPLIDKKEVAAILGKAITPAWLQQQIERNLDSFFEWFSYKKEILELYVDLSEIKAGAPAIARQELLGKTQSLPECTQDQLLRMASGEAVICAPPRNLIPEGMSVDAMGKEFAGIAEGFIGDIVEGVPDRISLKQWQSESGGETEGMVAELENARQAARLGSTMLKIACAVLAALLIVIFLLAGTVWAASALLASGIIHLAAMFGLKIAVKSGYLDKLAGLDQPMAGLSPETADYAKVAMTGIVSAFLHSAMAMAAIAAVAGIALLSAGLIYKKRLKNE